jgi:hypothetical protein
LKDRARERAEENGGLPASRTRPTGAGNASAGGSTNTSKLSSSSSITSRVNESYGKVMRTGTLQFKGAQKLTTTIDKQKKKGNELSFYQVLLFLIFY